jgi:hypothetical protein
MDCFVASLLAMTRRLLFDIHIRTTRVAYGLVKLSIMAAEPRDDHDGAVTAA